MKKAVSGLLVSAVTLSACAQSADNVTAAYVPQSLYSSQSCSQLVSDRQRVVAQVNHLTGEQNKKATNDAVAMGVGLILFWPALFLLAADKDESAALASMKGQYDAIEAAGRTKGCW